MRDPHVQEMYYEVNSGEGISYDDPEPVSFTNHLGKFDLREGILQIFPVEHFPEEEMARRAMEPFLQSWEIEADITSNIGTIRFKFEKVKLIDRDPPPPGSSQVIQPKTVYNDSVVYDVSLHLTKKKYPDPPTAFRATPEVQHGYRRWLRYRQGKESLQSMAYFVLTMLESVAGGRQMASNSYQIERKILDTIGKLSSIKGNESTARKAGSLKFQELTGNEKRWLEEAIQRVIQRLGETASGAQLKQITLTDFPKL